jgi:hypothetical protein
MLALASRLDKAQGEPYRTSVDAELLDSSS